MDENFLGFNRLEVTPSASASITTAPPVESSAPTEQVDSGPEPSAPTSDVPDFSDLPDATPAPPIEAGVPETEQLDSGPEPMLDASGPEPMPVEAAVAPEPMTPNVDLPNLFVDVLGVTPEEVTDKIEGTFEQLFYGDPNLEAIYFETSEDEAYIYDVFYEDTRIDALGYGLMISVLLDRQVEFDKIWRYTKNQFQYADGARAGYFRGKCKTTSSECDDNVPFAPFGAFYVTTALLFAEGRWGNGDGILNYGAEAREQLRVYINKEADNRGIVEAVTNAFDRDAYLPQALPNEEARGQITPSSVMPAFFEIWGARAQNPYWTLVAHRCREFLVSIPHPTTGLSPMRATFDGMVAERDAVFNENGYPVGFNLALDYAWYEHDERQIDVANRLTDFFGAFPGRNYPSLYATDGEPITETASVALLALNGATAGIATIEERDRLIRAVWETSTPVAIYRFYDGVNHLFSLLYLSGQFRAY